jgi:hypothetical protein
MSSSGLPGKKFDLARTSVVHASANGLWPHVTDVARWPEWFRDASGRHGLAKAEKLPTPPGTVDPLQPELGQRWRLAFTNGFEGEFRVTYWLEPAQISLGLVKETRKASQGIEGLILDLDLFPRPGDVTQLWFCALVMMEKGVKPGFFARWPRREVQAWVDGFHERLVAQGPALAGGVKTRKEAEKRLAAAR